MTMGPTGNTGMDNDESSNRPSLPEGAGSVDLPPIVSLSGETPPEREAYNPNLVSLPLSGRFPKRPPPLPIELPEVEAPRELHPGQRRRSEVQLEKARRRQEVFLQKRRQTKRRKVVYHRLRMVLRLVFAVLLSVGLAFALNASFWQLPTGSTTLKGNYLLGQAHLRRFLAPLAHQPIYQVNPLRLERQIRHTLPLVDQVYIRRHLWPQRGLDVFIIEKPSWALVYTAPFLLEKPVKPIVTKDKDGKFVTAPTPKAPVPAYLLHDDGTRTDLAAFHLPIGQRPVLGNPVIMVMPIVPANPDKLERFRDLARWLSHDPHAARLRYLDVSRRDNMVAYFDGFKVFLGRADSTLNSRVAPLFQMMPAIQAHKAELRFVDLRWNGQILFKRKSAKTGSDEDENAEPAPAKPPTLLQDTALRGTPR